MKQNSGTSVTAASSQEACDSEARSPHLAAGGVGSTRPLASPLDPFLPGAHGPLASALRLCKLADELTEEGSEHLHLLWLAGFAHTRETFYPIFSPETSVGTTVLHP